MRVVLLVSLAVPLFAATGWSQHRFAGRHCDITLPVDNEPLAKAIAVFYDRAIETQMRLTKSKPEKRYAVILFDDPTVHAEAVAAEKKKDRSSFRFRSSSRGFGANTYVTKDKALLFPKADLPTFEQAQALGLSGELATTIVRSAANVGSGGFLPAWLSLGLDAWREAQVLGVRSERERARDPMLSPMQIAVRKAAHAGELPTVRNLVDHGMSMDMLRMSFLREFVFMMMDRHEKPFLEFLREVQSADLFERKTSLAALLKRLPKDTDLDRDFKEHCRNLAPEWSGVGPVSFGFGLASYRGSRDRLLFGGSSSPLSTLLYRARPTGSRDYEISGRIEFVGDDESGAFFVSFNGEPESTRRSPPRLASVSIGRDGRVFVRDGKPTVGSKPKTSGKAPAIGAGKPVPFRVSVKGAFLTVAVAGRDVASCQMESDLSLLWGLGVTRDTTAIVHDLGFANTGLIAEALRQLEDPATAEEARDTLLANPGVLVGILQKRLPRSPFLTAKKPDPALELALQMPRRAGALLPPICAYLEKCDAGQAVAVLDTLIALAHRAPRDAQQALLRHELLAGAGRKDVDVAAWQSRCIELRARLAFDPGASIADLTRIVTSNRVFARELAAAELGRRGEVALAAVPALLARLKVKNSLGKGAKDVVVDDKPVVLRDRFELRAREALMAIAPRDPRLHKIYAAVLLDSDQSASRIAAAKALGAMRGEVPRAAVTAMIKAFKKASDDAVRLAIIQAFGKIGKPAKPALYHLRKTRDAKSASAPLRAAAAVAIDAIEGS